MKKQKLNLNKIKKLFLMYLTYGLFYVYNFLFTKNKQVYTSAVPELNEILIKTQKASDICDHLTTLFLEAYEIRPQLIVELGVRKGESTFVFERVAKLCHSKLVSVDYKDCSSASSWEDWLFVQADDLEFATNFKAWCEQRGIVPVIDVLFIDTSHKFDHTCAEINNWFGFLSDKAKVIFHDTNLQKICFRKNGAICLGYDNQRGVIMALENYFKTSFNEKEEFVDVRSGWLIKHFPYCAGLTILNKLNK